MDPTKILRDNTPAPLAGARAHGYVSPHRPAPTGFPEVGSKDNLLWVVVPEYSGDAVFGPCQWEAIHGRTLPAQGTPVIVAFDDSEEPQCTVVWWEGNWAPEQLAVRSELPGTAAGGSELFLQTPGMAALGVRWHLVYNAQSVSTHKWEFVGGPALWAGPSGAMEKSSKAVQELTGGPKVTVPVTGTYRVGLQMMVQMRTANLTEVEGFVCKGTTALTTALYHFTNTSQWAMMQAEASEVITLGALEVINVGVAATTENLFAVSACTISLSPIRLG